MPARTIPTEPASQPAILKAKGRPNTPVPTTDTIMFPNVCIEEAEPVLEEVDGDGATRGMANPFGSRSIDQLQALGRYSKSSAMVSAWNQKWGLEESRN